MASSLAFAIEKKINESATTTVYRAYQQALDRTVLLKVLRKELTGDEDFVARFLREARACAAIHSENIVQVYDLTEVDGAPAIVMEFVEGRSVKEILESEGKLPLDRVRRIAVEVLKGLSVAHGKGIVHRDIKPGNILVGTSGSIKVTDFGLATVPRSPTLTLDGMVLGTPAYMSPEQARGEIVDARTDLFSLGVTIIELLTGKRILEGNSYSECLRRILSFSVKNVEEDLAVLPPEFAGFLRTILSPRKEDRFASTEDALHALSGGALGSPSRGTKLSFRVKALAGLLLLVLVGVFVAKLSLKKEEPPVLMLPDTTHTVPTSSQRVDTTLTLSVISQPSASNIPDRRISAAELSHPLLSDSVTTSTDSGLVEVRCVPWGMVYVNNIYLGQTPLPRSVSVKSGTAAVTITNPLFDPITRNVTVPKNKQIVIEENFLSRAGYVMIKVIPWGEVYVDDRYRDTTPLGKPLITSVGIRKIRIHNPSYEDITYDARIAVGDTLNLSFNFLEKKSR